MATGIKESDVWTAADALLLAGEQPTVERVRLHLGRGSPNTVGPHLKAWFRGLGARIDGGAVGNTPGVPGVLHQAVAALWQSALTAAREEFRALREQEAEGLATAREELETGMDALNSERRKLELREADLLQSVHSARAQAQAADSRLVAAEDRAERASLTTQQAEARIEKALAEIQALQQEMRSLRQGHQHSLDAAEERHSAHERRWLTEIDEQRQVTKKAQEELDKVRKQYQSALARHQEEVADLRSRLEEQGKRTSLAEQESQTLGTQLRAVTQAADAAKESWENLLAQVTTQIQDLRGQLATKDHQMELLVQPGRTRKRKLAP